jgi:hypothetical protein
MELVESKGVEATAAGFVVRTARLLIAVLRAHQDGAGTLQVTLPVVCVKRQCGDLRVGGGADLAQRDGRVFPPCRRAGRSPARNSSATPRSAAACHRPWGCRGQLSDHDPQSVFLAFLLTIVPDRATLSSAVCILLCIGDKVEFIARCFHRASAICGHFLTFCFAF